MMAIIFWYLGVLMVSGCSMAVNGPKCLFFSVSQSGVVRVFLHPEPGCSVTVKTISVLSE
jgi:hypothetical protein